MAFPLWKDGACEHCGDEMKNPEEGDLHYRLECPECGREGCHACMPNGRNCVCPKCEEDDE